LIIREMNYKDYAALFLPKINIEIHRCCDRLITDEYSELSEMVAYHLGFTKDIFPKGNQGKKLRPMILLLSCVASGGAWELALPAATAIELIHNFSLIHDDIEDKSTVRHGRDTLWVKWGAEKAINAGDAIFAMAFTEILRLQEMNSSDIAVTAANILSRNCLDLTKGQSLDLFFEKEDSISVEDYLGMTVGKTSALFSAAAEIGSLIAGVERKTLTQLAQFGRTLGIASQMQDDWLGIWGMNTITGKSSSSDLITGKKTFPILFAIKRRPRLGETLKKGVDLNDIERLTSEISETGAEEYTLELIQENIDNCLYSLEKCNFTNEAGLALKELVENLIHRES
jgi:geranylgeranyl diphosphate synthase type I